MRKAAAEQHVGRHAMVELDGQRVLKKISPPRGLENSRPGVGHQCAVDQRPRVVEQSGSKAGDERTEIDLRERETDQCIGADPEALDNR